MKRQAQGSDYAILATNVEGEEVRLASIDHKSPPARSFASAMARQAAQVRRANARDALFGTKRRADWDNCHKLSCDALSGIAYEDDSR